MDNPFGGAVTGAKQGFIPLERIRDLVQLEPALVILGLAAFSWVFYRTFLKRVSLERHRHIRGLYWNILGHLGFGTALFLAHLGFDSFSEQSAILARFAAYTGALTMISGAIVFIKVSRLLLFEYLFFGHMKEGVPVLLVNLFTLVLTMSLFAWLASEIFNLRIMPLVATSAAVSLVVGLAIQDTLGNLFAGVALQFDKPYEIGDWVEIESAGGSHKWTGQVREISWRATVLTGFMNETVTIPNRVVSQSQIANYSNKGHPVIRRQVYRIPHGADDAKVRVALLESVQGVSGITSIQAPLVLFGETDGSWLLYRLVYFIDDFGSQYLIADQINRNVIAKLRAAGIELAEPTLALKSSLTSPS